ncbi:unnamed protein product [Plutella xylostella]|uniref:(diamondback moth) hypothetical protein n=1 Tax=Plutella xylostella TaxID=51655 RepID=A0A8S4DAW7_PLUXY|nr:unnamed protein product [Plutella xylostella]
MCTLLGNLILIVLVCMTWFPHVKPKDGVDVGQTKPELDPQKRALDGAVKEAVLQQKDALLDMLEKKLKEASENKKKRRLEDKVVDPARCDPLPDDVDMKIKANGINAVGDIDLLLKLGRNGKDNLRLESSGVSNVGKTYLEMGMPNNNLYIPGLHDLFTGSKRCKGPSTESKSELSEGRGVTEVARRAMEHIDVDKEDKNLNETVLHHEKTEDLNTEATINNTTDTTVAMDSANSTTVSSDDNDPLKLTENNTDGGENATDKVSSVAPTDGPE